MRDAKKLHDKHWLDAEQQINTIKNKGPVTRHLQDILSSLVSIIEFKSITDIGCGQGARLGMIHKKFPNVKCIGLDISDVAIKIAKKNYKDLTFKQLDIVENTISNKTDLVIILDVLEHIVDDRKALRNIRKMTNKYLIVSTIQGRMRMGEEIIGHVRNYKRDDLIQKIEEAGFHIEKIVEWGFPFYSPIYRNILESMFKLKSWTKRLLRKKRQEEQTSLHTPDILFSLADLLYIVMKYNSHSRGDYIFILARVVDK